MSLESALLDDVARIKKDRHSHLFTTRIRLRLETVFQAFDDDRQGFLTGADQITPLVSMVMNEYESSPNTTSLLLPLLDFDMDGRVSTQDFIHYCKDATTNVEGKMSRGSPGAKLEASVETFTAQCEQWVQDYRTVRGPYRPVGGRP